MSKIHDALRKIQGGKEPAPENAEASSSAPIARLTQSTTGAEFRQFGDDARLVAVDRNLLRRHGLLAPENQARFVADQYRLIKRPILANIAQSRESGDDEPMNLIMVASALPGDGKTFNCINLALSIASERDVSVVLVDADVAKQHISALFGIGDEPGLIDLLADTSLSIRDVVIRTDIPSVYLMPAGSRSEDATELFASRRMAEVAGECAAMNSSTVFIFDSPPILATSESRVLASSVGQVVVVVRASATPQHSVIEALEGLDASKPINLLLNESGYGFGLEGQEPYGYPQASAPRARVLSDAG